MSELLKVHNLKVRYGNNQALKGINFSVNEGQIVTLIGANGAGKTSTLRALSNVIDGQKSGEVYFQGNDISHKKSEEIVWAGISHIPEGRHVFPKLTVEENLLMGTFGSKTFRRPEATVKLEEIYTMFPRLKERQNQLGGTLSGGEQQMLVIGRGLMFSPKLLMLDEPSLGLAPIIVKEVFELILDIREQGITTLLVEQNAGMALQIADQGYVLENGLVMLSGTGEELMKNEMIAKAYLGM